MSAWSWLEARHVGHHLRKAQNRIQDRAKLNRLISGLIGREQWTTLSVDVMRPEPGQLIHDPACGTGGFLLAMHDYISKHYQLDKDDKKFLKEQALSGTEIVDGTARLCVMNRKPLERLQAQSGLMLDGLRYFEALRVLIPFLVLDVLYDCFLIHYAHRRAKVASCLHVLAPISLAQMRRAVAEMRGNHVRAFAEHMDDEEYSRVFIHKADALAYGLREIANKQRCVFKGKALVSNHYE